MSDVALVTGASRGIGRAIALELARAGYSVAVHYRNAVEEAKEVAAEIAAAGGEAICIRADVTQRDQVDGCFDDVEAALGPVTVLVNNAGIRADSLALRMSDDAWNEVIATNLYGPFAFCRRALRTMVAGRRGRIVNIASIAGVKGSPGQANYSAAKAGLIGLTKTLAREVGARGITVNAVAPGLIATDLTADLTDAQRDALVAEIPAGAAGAPHDVGGLVTFLCSEAASYINGSVFVIDGGTTA